MDFEALGKATHAEHTPIDRLGKPASNNRHPAVYSSAYRRDTPLGCRSTWEATKTLQLAKPEALRLALAKKGIVASSEGTRGRQLGHGLRKPKTGQPQAWDNYVSGSFEFDDWLALRRNLTTISTPLSSLLRSYSLYHVSQRYYSRSSTEQSP